MNTVAKVSIQEYADKVMPQEFRMPLMAIEQALAKIGWEYVDRPTCCGKEVLIDSFLGDSYRAYCETCGRFVLDVTGPTFGNSWVNLVDGDKVDLQNDFDRRWIAGIKPASNPSPAVPGVMAGGTDR